MNSASHQLLFDSALRSQFAWRRKAADLLKSGMVILQQAADARPAAEVLATGPTKQFSAQEGAPLEEFRLYDVGIFLVALAIENLLKGLWIGRNYERIKEVKNQRDDLEELNTHELGSVAKAAAMQLSADEVSLLADLSKIIRWYGRYSTPMKVSEYGNLIQHGPPSNRFLKGSTIFTMDLPFPAELGKFIERALGELDTIPNENWA